MATWTAFYVRASTEDVVEACKVFLKNTKTTVSRGPFPVDVRLNSKGQRPRRLIARAIDNGWQEVHSAGFYTRDPAAVFFSQHFNSSVVSTSAQTNGDAYELTVLESGQQIRRLEFQEYDWVAQEGKPFATEPSPLATILDIEEEDVPYFHVPQMKLYCRRVFDFTYWKDGTNTDEWIDVNAERRGFFGWLKK